MTDTKRREIPKGHYFNPYMVSHEDLMDHILYDKFSQVEIWGDYKFLCRNDNYLWITDAPEGTVIVDDLVVNSENNHEIKFYKYYDEDCII